VVGPQGVVKLERPSMRDAMREKRAGLRELEPPDRI
jgi:hypothetical protein